MVTVICSTTSSLGSMAVRWLAVLYIGFVPDVKVRPGIKGVKRLVLSEVERSERKSLASQHSYSMQFAIVCKQGRAGQLMILTKGKTSN